MGIRGLATRAEKYIRPQHTKVLEGAVIYVDLQNLLHSIVHRIKYKETKEIKQNTFLQDFRRLWAFQVEFLINLKPVKLVFAGDGFARSAKEDGDEKPQQRNQNAQNFLVYLGLEYLTNLCKLGVVQTVLCGNEAEDEIIKMIVEDSAKKQYANRSFYIFSRDSDLFTFTLPDKLAKRVYAVPKGPWQTGYHTVYSINFYNLQVAKEANPKDLRPPPSETPGKNMWNPKPSAQKFLTVFNQALLYHEHRLYFRDVWVPFDHRGVNVHYIGYPLIEVFHGVFMEKHFPDRSEPLVTGIPQGSKYIEKLVPLIQGKPLHDATKLLLENPLWETVVFHFENLPKKEAFRSHEIEAVGAYVRALVEGRPMRLPEKKARNADILHSYLKALCMKFICLEAVVDDFFSHHLVWRVCPWELSPFLEVSEQATRGLTSQFENLRVSDREQEVPQVQA